MKHWPRRKKFVSWCLLLHIFGIEEVAIVVTFQPLDETGTSNGSLCQLVIRLQICYTNSAMCELASGLCRCKVKLFRCGQRVLQEGLTLSMPLDDSLIIGLSFERWQCFSRRNVCCSGIILMHNESNDMTVSSSNLLQCATSCKILEATFSQELLKRHTFGTPFKCPHE